jgi:hypothetical protein
MSRFAEDGPGAGRQAAVVVSDRPNRRVCFETRGYTRGGATSAGGSGLSCLCAPSTPATAFIDDCVMITGRCVGNIGESSVGDAKLDWDSISSTTFLEKGESRL